MSWEKCAPTSRNRFSIQLSLLGKSSPSSKSRSFDFGEGDRGDEDLSPLCPLYRLGAIAALLAGFIFRRNLDAEWMLLRGLGLVQSGPFAAPDTIRAWLDLLHRQPLLGLTFLNVFDLVNFALLGLMILALGVALWRVNPSRMALAIVLGGVGVAVYFAANQAFPMLMLSRQYAAAVGETQRASIEAAGLALLAIHHAHTYAGPGLYPAFFLVSASGLLISLTMKNTGLFNRWTAWTGILANTIQLSYYIVLPLAPAWVVIPIVTSAVFLMIWYILVGISLWKLGT